MSPVTRVVLIALGGGLALLFVVVIRKVSRGIAPGVMAGWSKIRADNRVTLGKPAYAALLKTAQLYEAAAWVLPEPSGTDDWTRSYAGWAIHYYEKALAACDPEDRPPVDRAAAEAGLGRVKLFTAQLGQAPVANLWESIEFSRRALETYTSKSHPEAWSSAQVTLAAAFCERSKRSHHDTEQAVELCRKVIKGLDCGPTSAHAAFCAQAHYTKAKAHFKQYELELAEKHFNDALELLKSAGDHRHRARALCGLGWVYLGMAHSDKKSFDDAYADINVSGVTLISRANVPMAMDIDSDQKERSLCQSRYPEKMPQLLRFQEARKTLLERLEEAKQCFESASGLLSVADAPRELGDAHAGLADVVEFRLELAPKFTGWISRSTQGPLAALRRRQAEVGAPPRQLRQARLKLGDFYFHRQEWEKALKVYARAMEADKALFRLSLTGQGRRAFAGQGEPAYRRAAFCQIKINQAEEALSTLEAGKTRVLSERLNRDRPEWLLVKDSEDQQQYKAAVSAHVSALQRLEAALGAGPLQQDDMLTETVERAKEELEKIESKLRSKYPGFLPGLGAKDLSQLATDKTAIVVPVLTEMGGAVILVTAQDGVKAVQLPDFDLPTAETLVWKLEDEQAKRWLDARDDGGWSGVLAEIAASDGDSVADKLGWVPAYRLHDAVVATLSDSRHHEDAREVTLRWWQEVIQRVLEELYEWFWLPVLAKLPAQVNRLVIVPQGVLHLIPIGAALERQREEVILDRYAVSYTPSLNVLQESRQLAQATATVSPILLAAEGSQGPRPLPYIGLEVDAIARIWKERVRTEPRLLKGSVAEETFLEDATYANYIHYSGHAKHDRTEPLESGLLVQSGDALTVKEIQERGVLRMSRLVVLSACETGLVDTATAPEEYVGLPAAFMMAGAPCVISSLWPVNDIATALLMGEFYRNLIEKRMSTPLALAQAQHWLRKEIDRPFVIEHIDSLLADLEMQRAQVSSWGEIGKSIAQQMWDLKSVRSDLLREEERKPGGRFFDHPFYWAAFIVSGAQVTMTKVMEMN